MATESRMVHFGEHSKHVTLATEWGETGAAKVDIKQTVYEGESERDDQRDEQRLKQRLKQRVEANA